MCAEVQPMANNNYKFYQNQGVREGVAFFGLNSMQHQHLSAPYPLVGNIFDIPGPAPFALVPPPQPEWQDKLLKGAQNESQLLKEVNPNQYLDKGLKRGTKTKSNPDSESTAVQAKRLKLDKKTKHLLCF